MDLKLEMETMKVNLDEAAGEKAGWLEIVRRQVQSLRFGVVQIVVHDSQVTQVERTGRVRLDKVPARKP